ncbi:WD repeat domain-containing protein [Colletotrichum higginsianum]|nr:WD repeat domain-containing protein [Colletotrichum higginsianum]
MKSTPLIINWHDQNAPVYSAHFEPHGKGRLATAGGDNNVRLWKVETDGEDRKVDYLSTLTKHTQAVNVVRWAPKGEILASAGDDGNVIIWVMSEHTGPAFGNEGLEDKETWRTKHMCRSSGSEIYDLAWSPDSSYFIIGSMDNIARIYNASSVRQIAEHSHYVQGVAWDPLNEYIATQSSDRSVHIYSLKTKDGQHTLSGNHDDKPSKIASHNKSDLPPRRISSSSPAPPDFSMRTHLTVEQAVGSPVPSAPGTPTSMALPMNPRVLSAIAVLVLVETLAIPGSVNAPARRHAPGTFAEASPLGRSRYEELDSHNSEGGAKPTFEVTNTVYIYTRGGINKAPIAHLPGHKKPSVVVKCSPVFYTLRTSPPVTKHITIDTSSSEDPIPALPEPVAKPTGSTSVMDPPPPPTSVPESSPASAKTEPSVSTPGRLAHRQEPCRAWEHDGDIVIIEPEHSDSHPKLGVRAPSPFHNGGTHHHRNSASSFTAPSPPPAGFVSQRPHSPARSNSTSSVATQSSNVVTNPSLIVGSVPGIAVANSTKVTGVPITTPPETPRTNVAPSTAASGTKRDASEGEKEEGSEPKKRRIAPTLVEQKP